MGWVIKQPKRVFTSLLASLFNPLAVEIVLLILSGRTAPLHGQTPSTQSDGAGPATAPSVMSGQDSEPAGPGIAVTSLEIRYKGSDEDLPNLEHVRSRWVALRKAGDVYTATSASTTNDLVIISDIGKAPYTSFDRSAINAICEQLAKFVNEAGIYAVYAEPDPDDIDVKGEETDVRKAKGRTALTLNVWVARVTRVRTIASGERVPTQERIDNPLHAKIVENSPIRPATTQSAGTDRIRKSDLDNYALRLNRYPGRRVDAALTAGEDPGDIWLDYLVTETKPWTVLAQISNTGTKATNEWRERFAGIAYQTFNRDDIIALDYTTGGFSDSQYVNLAYEGNLTDSGNVRWKAFGLYSEYTASDLAIGSGQGNLLANLSGTEWAGALELTPNLAQWRETFLDGFIGTQVQSFETSSGSALAGDGQATFYGVYGGFRLDRLTDTTSSIGEIRLSYNTTSASQNDVDNLGQPGAERSFLLLQGNVSHSFYLDPLLFPSRFRDEQSNVSANLVNELYFSANIQDSFGSTIVPQTSAILGGLYTIRGYDESVVSGDSAIWGTAEYRFHFPRALAPATGVSAQQTVLARLFGPDFRERPDRTKFGRTDWDLILRAFVDAGQTYSDVRGRNNETLVGSGVGIELQIKQNVDIRLDYGVALHDAGDVNAGDSRLHVVATFSY